MLTAEAAERAYAEWGCNCGPAAIAAVLNLDPDDVRPHMGDFETKRYTNPTLMWASLQRLRVRFSYRGGRLGQQNWPVYGLARIQWEGPWTWPGVPPRAASPMAGPASFGRFRTNWQVTQDPAGRHQFARNRGLTGFSGGLTVPFARRIGARSDRGYPDERATYVPG